MGLIITTGMLSFILLGVSCTPSRDFNTRLSSIVKPYNFSIAKWEFNTIFNGAKRVISGKDKKIGDEIDKVTEYFSCIERIKSIRSEIEAINAGNKQGDLAPLEAELNRLQQQKIALEDTVERVIERQIKETLTQQGIFNPVDKYIKLKVNFPPLNFKLEKPPHLLVISPRDRIESMREIPLKQNIKPGEMESIEAEVDKLGVSSLVVELGGFGGTYPAFVTNEASLRFTIDTAAEEWLHQYIAFKPLGFLYMLDLIGVRRNYEIATMSETLTSMVSKEIGSIVDEKYYPQLESNGSQPQQTKSGFDFNREMREIRRAVDKYLAQGEIEQAEEFMEQKRQYLATKGYYIRKLNQAYFAFYGTYADRPTSISPIGPELKKLRSQSASLKDFLEKVAVMTSRQDLIDSLKKS
ncbi:MAG: hypothetical protein ACE5LA_03425 [Dehalococcoidales bacterium]